jgi:hypothetical protein
MNIFIRIINYDFFWLFFNAFFAGFQAVLLIENGELWRIIFIAVHIAAFLSYRFCMKLDMKERY